MLWSTLPSYFSSEKVMIDMTRKKATKKDVAAFMLNRECIADVLYDIISIGRVREK